VSRHRRRRPRLNRLLCTTADTTLYIQLCSIVANYNPDIICQRRFCENECGDSNYKAWEKASDDESESMQYPKVVEQCPCSRPWCEPEIIGCMVCCVAYDALRSGEGGDTWFTRRGSTVDERYVEMRKPTARRRAINGTRIDWSGNGSDAPDASVTGVDGDMDASSADGNVGSATGLMSVSGDCDGRRCGNVAACGDDCGVRRLRMVDIRAQGTSESSERSGLGRLFSCWVRTGPTVCGDAGAERMP